MSERLTLLDADNSLPALDDFFGTPQPAHSREGVFNINVARQDDITIADGLSSKCLVIQRPGV